jgi:hypothetical protein
MTRLSNGLVGLAEAEATGRLSIAGDREAALALIDALSMVPVAP